MQMRIDIDMGELVITSAGGIRPKPGGGKLGLVLDLTPGLGRIEFQAQDAAALNSLAAALHAALGQLDAARGSDGARISVELAVAPGRSD